MSKDTEAVVEDVVVEKAPKVEIIRGRMPVQVVKMIRFHSETDMTKSVIAALYRTTVGKINDVVAGSNFGYVGEDFKPTAEQLEAAKGYIAQCNSPELTTLVDSFEVATDDEAAGFEDARKASRKVREKKDTEEVEEGVENVVEEDDELID